MKNLAVAFLFACACSGGAGPAPTAPSNQPGSDVATAEPTPKAAPPEVAVELRSGGIMTPGTGAVSGTISDTAGERVMGATVVAAGPALQGSQTAISDEQGQFQIGDLPPGSYTITFYYSDQDFEHPAEVVAGSRTDLRVARWDLRTGGEVILISP